MIVQLSVAVRNARLDAIEATIGTSAVMKILAGTMPANCAAADAGTTLATATLPSDWMSNAASGVKGMSGTWEDTSADATGGAVYFRIYDSGGTTCHMQGNVTLTAGGGAMTVDNINFGAGQPFTVTAFNITDGNA